MKQRRAEALAGHSSCASVKGFEGKNVAHETKLPQPSEEEKGLPWPVARFQNKSMSTSQILRDQNGIARKALNFL